MGLGLDGVIHAAQLAGGDWLRTRGGTLMGKGPGGLADGELWEPGWVCGWRRYWLADGVGRLAWDMDP